MARQKSKVNVAIGRAVNEDEDDSSSQDKKARRRKGGNRKICRVDETSSVDKKPRAKSQGPKRKLDSTSKRNTSRHHKDSAPMTTSSDAEDSESQEESLSSHDKYHHKKQRSKRFVRSTSKSQKQRSKRIVRSTSKSRVQDSTSSSSSISESNNDSSDSSQVNNLRARVHSSKHGVKSSAASTTRSQKRKSRSVSGSGSGDVRGKKRKKVDKQKPSWTSSVQKNKQHSADSSYSSDIPGSSSGSGSMVSGNQISDRHIQKVSKCFDSLDMKMWKSGYTSANRNQVFNSIYKKVRDLVVAEQQLVTFNNRQNYTWDQSFQKWVSYGKKNPARKNRVPLSKVRLSGWVHQQRKDYKDGKLTDEKILILEEHGFNFNPRKSSRVCARVANPSQVSILEDVSDSQSHVSYDKNFIEDTIVGTQKPNVSSKEPLLQPAADTEVIVDEEKVVNDGGNHGTPNPNVSSKEPLLQPAADTVKATEEEGKEVNDGVNVGTPNPNVSWKEPLLQPAADMEKVMEVDEKEVNVDTKDGIQNPNISSQEPLLQPAADTEKATVEEEKEVNNGGNDSTPNPNISSEEPLLQPAADTEKVMKLDEKEVNVDTKDGIQNPNISSQEPLLQPAADTDDGTTNPNVTSQEPLLQPAANTKIPNVFSKQPLLLPTVKSHNEVKEDPALSQSSAISTRLRARKLKPEKSATSKKPSANTSVKSVKSKATEQVVSLLAESDVVEPDSYLFEFDNNMSGRRKLKAILDSEYTHRSSKYKRQIAFYTKVHGYDDHELLYDDFIKYKSKGYISSNVINAYFFLLDRHFSLEKNHKGHSVRFCLSSLWDHYIRNPEYHINKLSDQMRRELCDHIYFPINVNNNHWILVVVHWREEAVDIYDSMDLQNKKISDILMSRVNEMVKLDSGKSWNINNHYHDAKVQRQVDSHSCAFFTCWYAYELASGGSIEPWTGDSHTAIIESISEKIFVSIIERKILMSDN
jgi:hypothetical protein